MREIKFRAWDVENNKMWMPKELWNHFVLIPDRGLFQNLATGEIFDSNIKNKWANHMIPLEYIGIKDHTDKEIWEGDVLTANIGSLQSRYEVIIEDGHAQLILKDSDGTLKFFLDKSNISLYEVIGNVYENPELLKA